MNLEDWKDKLLSYQTEQSVINREINSLKDKINSLDKEEENYEEALRIAQVVAEETQSELSFHVSDIVSHALTAVFDDAYKFELKFIQKRNKTEAELSFTRDGNDIDPMNACGGGVVDIASFALRMAMLMLQRKRAPILILDEPFRFVSSDYQEKAGLLLQELSHRLGIQIIMVTHNEFLENIADKVFSVRNIKGKAKVALLENGSNKKKSGEEY